MIEIVEKIKELEERLLKLGDCLWLSQKRKNNWELRKRNSETRFLGKQRQGNKDFSGVERIKRWNKNILQPKERAAGYYKP